MTETLAPLCAGVGQEAKSEQHLIPNMLHVDTNDPTRNIYTLRNSWLNANKLKLQLSEVGDPEC